MIAIGQRLAPILAAENDIAEVGRILDKEINGALMDLAALLRVAGKRENIE